MTMSMEAQLHHRVTACWTIKERDPRTGLFIPKLARRNKFTDYGLTNLAQSWMGQGTPPLYLVIDSWSASVQNANGLAVGATSVTLDQLAHKAGDTQLVLDVGGAGQEVVSFSAVSGSGPYVYTISATTNTHAHGALVVRQVLQSDTMSDIKSEVQYDSVAAPNARMKTSGSGYSQGTGNQVMQFFLTGSQALAEWVCLGLSETGTTGQGQLHNHLVFGFNHQSGNDVEVDISLSLSNA